MSAGLQSTVSVTVTSSKVSLFSKMASMSCGLAMVPVVSHWRTVMTSPVPAIGYGGEVRSIDPSKLVSPSSTSPARERSTINGGHVCVPTVVGSPKIESWVYLPASSKISVLAAACSDGMTMVPRPISLAPAAFSAFTSRFSSSRVGHTNGLPRALRVPSFEPSLGMPLATRLLVV